MESSVSSDNSDDIRTEKEREHLITNSEGTNPMPEKGLKSKLDNVSQTTALPGKVRRGSLWKRLGTSSTTGKCSKKQCKKVILIVFCGIIIILLAVLSVIFLLASLIPHHQPPNDFVESVGDQNTNNYTLLPLPSSAYLVTIQLLQPGNVTANISVSSSEPTKTTQHLPQKNTSQYYGGRRYSYNYYGDQPIYLLPDSSITYMMSILNNNGSTCPTQLYLFDNVTSCVNFKNYQNYTAVASSPCLSKNLNWTFHITEQGSYYVAINIDTGVYVTSNVSVARVYYNITGLKSPSECSQPLSADHPSCQMALQCSKFYCNREKKYLLVIATGKVNISYSFLGPPTIDGTSKYFLFFFGISFIIIGCFILIIVITCCIAKRCKKYFQKKDGVQSSSRTTDHTEHKDGKDSIKTESQPSGPNVELISGQHASTDEKTFWNLQEQNGAEEQVLKDPSTSDHTENRDVSHSIQKSPPLDQRDGNHGPSTLDQDNEEPFSSDSTKGKKNDIKLVLDKKPIKKHIVVLLAKNAHEYTKFAIALDVDDGFVKGLSGDDNVVKLSEIIKKWMTTRSCPVTWRTIIDAVKGDILGNNIELAKKITDWLEEDENFDYYLKQ